MLNTNTEETRQILWNAPEAFHWALANPWGLFRFGLAFVLFAGGLWLMWNGWRASHALRKRLGGPRGFFPAADSAIIIVSTLCLLVVVWTLRLR